MKNRIWIYTIIGLILLGCREEKELTPYVSVEEKTIGDFLEENSETYSIFYELASQSGIIQPLKLHNPYGNNKFTLFLPGNSAFEAFMTDKGYSTLEDLMKDSVTVNFLTRFHVLASSFRSSEFPFGALGDSTFTGEYLYMGFDEDFNYRVNNSVDIIQLDIELYNGYIHIVDEVLEPIVSNSYQYLKERNEYSLITELFEITGLIDTMNVFKTTEQGKEIRNYYTLLVETNEVFERFGINHIDSLIALHASEGLEYTDPENGLYQYAAYHMLEGRFAINDFTDNQPYVTYAKNPMMVDATQDIIINKGIEVFDTIVVSGDSVNLDYIRVNLYESNAFSLNGPVHTLLDPMVIQNPVGTYEFQFYNEPIIEENKRDVNISPLVLSDPSELINFSWTGVESIYYLAGVNGPKNGDCIYVFGNFSLNYITPNVAPGQYEIRIRVHKGVSSPQIKVYIDGVQQKSIIDLTLGKLGYRTIPLGKRYFEDFGPHTITIESIVGGELLWDWVQFSPM